MSGNMSLALYRRAVVTAVKPFVEAGLAEATADSPLAYDATDLVKVASTRPLIVLRTPFSTAGPLT